MKPIMVMIFSIIIIDILKEMIFNDVMMVTNDVSISIGVAKSPIPEAQPQ